MMLDYYYVYRSEDYGQCFKKTLLFDISAAYPPLKWAVQKGQAENLKPILKRTKNICNIERYCYEVNACDIMQTTALHDTLSFTNNLEVVNPKCFAGIACRCQGLGYGESTYQAPAIYLSLSMIAEGLKE